MRKIIFVMTALIIAGCSSTAPMSDEVKHACTYEDMLQLANAAVEAGNPKELDAEEKEHALPKLTPACREAVSGEKTTKPILLPRLEIKEPKTAEEGIHAFLGFVTDSALNKTLRSFPLQSLDDLMDPKTRGIPAIGAPKGTPIQDVIALDAIADDRVRAKVTDGATFGGKEGVTTVPMKGERGRVNVDLVTIGEHEDDNFLIYLPSPYMVATNSSIHRELYPHDTSYVIEALLVHPTYEDVERVRSMLEDFAYEVQNLGHVLNGNRGYYLTRSQTNNVPTNVWQCYQAAKEVGMKDADTWLAEVGIPLAKAVHAYWQAGDGTVHLREGRKGNRWIAHGQGPCQEVWESHGTHKAYYFRVLDELVNLEQMPDAERPFYAQGFDYSRVIVPLAASEVEHLKKQMADHLYVLPRDHTNSGKDEPVIKTSTGTYYTFTPFYYASDRASRVSGYDSNHLYGPFNAFTGDFVPAAHNVQLYRHERDIAHMLRAIGKDEEASAWDAKANARKEMIFATMWDDDAGMLFDYDVRLDRKRTEYPFASSAYALWAGLFDPNSSKERTKLQRMVEYVEQHLESANGLYASVVDTGLHWDKPFCWPIQQGMIVTGLREYADRLRSEDATLAERLTDFADRIALKYLKANYRKWLRSKGQEIQEKVGPDEGVFTGYENQANYTWNLAAVWDLYGGLTPAARANFHAYVALMKLVAPS